ncbi:MarR family winged helix-turn-helix transcriptional regulator [Natronohydrobacter thiooxidans]|jgi:DNA-binding MarR family transcriptional regulator|uniref:MarR family winged helix-turn-helix transcriptional regulator n=1 Tax=Natronohydrobacter thiooxidans TaxID=87172 RepID=UPI0008FF7035|nr:MarR family transcriptional regulator [Natronohydrobacter thiooxidans]
MTREKRTSDADIVPAQPELEEFIGYNLKRAYVIVQSDFRRVLGEDGFSPRAFSALSLVVQYPNITQTGLAKMLGIERSGLVAIVDDLEQRGFVRRTHVPSDRRVQALLPTKAGAKAIADATDAVRAHENTLFASFTPEERSTLMALLLRVRELGE